MFKELSYQQYLNLKLKFYDDSFFTKNVRIMPLFFVINIIIHVSVSSNKLRNKIFHSFVLGFKALHEYFTPFEHANLKVQAKVDTLQEQEQLSYLYQVVFKPMLK